MKFLHKVHLLTEVGSMIAGSYAAVVTAIAMREQADDSEEVIALKQALSKALAAKKRK